MPGAVKTMAAASVERFCAYQPLGSLRVDLLRHARLAVRHLVVRFAVDDPVEGVVVVAIAERVADGGERALLILGGDHRLADGVDEVGIPLRAEPGAAGPDVLGEPLVVLQVLGDRDPAGEFLSDLAVDPWSRLQPSGRSCAAGAVGRCECRRCRRNGGRPRGIPRATCWRYRGCIGGPRRVRNRAGCLPTV